MRTEDNGLNLDSHHFLDANYDRALTLQRNHHHCHAAHSIDDDPSAGTSAGMSTITL